MLRAYRAAMRNDENFDYANINHGISFVDLNDPAIHIQSIESFWSHEKKKLRKKNGINKSNEFNHLVKFIWDREIDKLRKFNEIILLFMAEDYDLYFTIFLIWCYNHNWRYIPHAPILFNVYTFFADFEQIFKQIKFFLLL